jgi:site-specific recombinase XerD
MIMDKKHQLSWLVARVALLLQAKKYKDGYIQTYLTTWEQLKAYMFRLGIVAYDRSVGEGFLKERFGKVAYNQLKRTWKEVFHRVEVLSHYQEKGDLLKQHIRAPEITFSDKLGQPFATFIEYSKGIKRSEGTIENYRKCLDIFYQYLKQSGKTLKDISARDMVQFLLKLDQRYNDGTRRLIITEIRVFFQFLCFHRLLSDNRQQYWMSILQSRSIRQPKIPSIYSVQEIERLIAAVDRGSPVGKRNYVMILLAARYGLRLSDVISLRFCNIDWPNNRISLVQRKTQRNVSFPLSEEVGNAIIDYLKFGRPESEEPLVFLTATAPYCQLSKTALNRTITECMEKADISYEERKRGLHSLRNSLATHLLSEKEPLPVIAEILGHSSTESTKYYLRVDFKQLKQCALDVPCVPASFYENLYAL